MGTELFLMLLTLSAAFVKKAEVAPALLYTLLAFTFYFISLISMPTTTLLILAMGMEVVTVGLMLCLKGCLQSRIVSCLIPLSIIALSTHFVGWCLLYNGFDISFYNNLVDVYWAVILGIFLSMSRWVSGNYNKFIHVFRRHGDQSGIV
jgi:hypothetical protein